MLLFYSKKHQQDYKGSTHLLNKKGCCCFTFSISGLDNKNFREMKTYDFIVSALYVQCSKSKHSLSINQNSECQILDSDQSWNFGFWKLVEIAIFPHSNRLKSRFRQLWKSNFYQNRIGPYLNYLNLGHCTSYYWHCTAVWKFANFPTTQILREINFCDFANSMQSQNMLFHSFSTPTFVTICHSNSWQF